MGVGESDNRVDLDSIFTNFIFSTNGHSVCLAHSLAHHYLLALLSFPSTAGFCCLERHFALVNIQDGYLLAYMSGNDRYLVLDMDHLHGLDYLWAVALDARDVHVSRAAMEVSENALFLHS